MAVNFVGIPSEIKTACRFCTWKYETRGGRKTKVPYNPATGGKAQTDKPETFSDFKTAMTAVAMGRYDGIGIRVDSGGDDLSDTGGANNTSATGNTSAVSNTSTTGNTSVVGGIGAIDIDHCIREDGSLNDIAASILAIFPGIYVEKSPSGTGLRAFFRVAPDYVFDKATYYINNHKLGLEIYVPGATNRFVTVTGDVYREGSVPLATEQLSTALDKYMKRKQRIINTTVEACSYLTDEQVLEHAAKAANGERFMDYYEGNWQKYYDNQSDADMAFVSMLAFWCGNVEEQIDRIYRASGMMRDKWDRPQSGSTYGALTIRNVVLTNDTIYLPINPANIHDPTADFEMLEDDVLGDTEDMLVDDKDVLSDEGGFDKTASHTAKPTERAGQQKSKKAQPVKKRLDFKPDIRHITLTLEEMQPHTNPRYQRDEIGIGNAFADYFKPIARFNRDRGIWYVYDGKVWRSDEGGLAVAELAKLLADRLYTFALQITDEDTRTRYIKRVQKLQLRRNRRTMVEDAKSVYPVSHSVFDSSKYLFNCQNGTLNLRNMEFQSHSPADFITKVSPVTYDPEATSERWNRFVDEVMQGKTAVSRYFQKAVGYALTGDTSLECLFIMYGPTTRNGKTTAIETILHVLGEYGISSKPDMLASNYFRGPSNGAPSEDVARLNGARFVGISEMEQKLTLNASLTKQLTGNNRITARFLHENSFDFYLQAKIFIDTNHLPNVTDQTLFESGRLKIIPFNRHFEDHEQDKTLKSTLMKSSNLSGILNWIVEGYRLFRAEGLKEPGEVTEATSQYQKESDRISQFIDQCLTQKSGAELKTKAVYTRYREWCAENGYKYEGSQGFYKRLGLVYTISKRRPWSMATTGSNSVTLLVDDVAWANGEEPELEIVPDE